MRKVVFVSALLGLFSGCIPIVIPPVHSRLGGGKASAALPHTDINNQTTRHNSLAMVAIGLDSAASSEAPVAFEGGVLTNFEHYAYYVEGGPMRRFGEHLRVAAAAGAEWWPGADEGAGVRTSVTVEYAGRLTRESGTEVSGFDNHDKTTTTSWQSGAFAIGAFVDAGHRWIHNEPNYTYIVFGLSFRLPALIGIVDVSEQH
jgi:hypothetical protein